MCRKRVCSAMNERQLFWLDKNRWPRRDPPGFVFLARAFDELGRARLDSNWTGAEGGAGPSPSYSMRVAGYASRREFARELRRQAEGQAAHFKEHPELRS